MNTPNLGRSLKWTLIGLQLFLLSCCYTLPAGATAEGSGTWGDMVVFRGNFEPLSPAGASGEAASPQSKLGWRMPGQHYRAGSGWWALICLNDDGAAQRRASCRLAPTSLSIKAGKLAAYDSDPVAGQLLHWSPLPGQLNLIGNSEDKQQRVVIVFKASRTLAGLRFAAGPVVTYLHDSMKSYPRPPGPGTLEVRIPVAAGQYVDLVPRVNKAPPSAAETQEAREADQMAAVLHVFELRDGASRQRLPGQSGQCPGDALSDSRQYLLWAGDLDGDGKLDFIMTRDRGSDVTLYLSSAAKDGEIVGEAGGFARPNLSSGEC